MLYIVCQPQKEYNVLDLFRKACEQGPFDKLSVAVAYITCSGCYILLPLIRELTSKWPRLKIRWLTSFDWCRSEPEALLLLNNMPNSKVKIHNGIEVLRSDTCTPKIPFHAKTYLFSSPRHTAFICGSSNLSKYGLTLSCEVNLLVYTESDAAGEVNSQINEQLQFTLQWFDFKWGQSIHLSRVFNKYNRIYEKIKSNIKHSTVDDDPVKPNKRERSTGIVASRSLQPIHIDLLKNCRFFWMEFVPSRNMAHGGNQLHMTQFTRSFFGFDSVPIPRDTSIGAIQIKFKNRISNYSLRYSNNGMDVLNLPPPSSNYGPPTYEDSILCFEKRSNSVFFLSIGSERDKVRWKENSEMFGGLFTMTSGRQWGVF